MKILDGVHRRPTTLFCVLYELDEGDDWRDEAVWIKALPMIGMTPTLDYVRHYRDDAIATPGLQGEFEVEDLQPLAALGVDLVVDAGLAAVRRSDADARGLRAASAAASASTSPSAMISPRSRSSSNATA